MKPCTCTIGEWTRPERKTIPQQQRWTKSVMRKLDNEQRKQGKEKRRD